MTSCCRAWGLWGSGADCVRLSGRCRGSLLAERRVPEPRSPVTRGDWPYMGTVGGDSWVRTAHATPVAVSDEASVCVADVGGSEMAAACGAASVENM